MLSYQINAEYDCKELKVGKAENLTGQLYMLVQSF